VAWLRVHNNEFEMLVLVGIPQKEKENVEKEKEEGRERGNVVQV